MAKLNKDYWRERALDRLNQSELKGVAAIAQTQAIYDKALKNINAQIQEIYDNYSEKGNVDVAKLKKALTPQGRKAFLRSIEQAAQKLGVKPDELYDDRYLERLTRLDALKEQAKLEIMAIAPQEIEASEAKYKEVLETTYSNTQKDLATMGVTPGFATLNKDIVTQILNSKWVGGNYSSRVWANVDELATELPEILGGGLASGASTQRTAMEIRKRFEVSKYVATRLVRTETNYFHNQAELQSYIDDGIKYYEYDAMMDGRTSLICQRLNEKKFKVSEAVPGVNYPPMHPNCRSTTVVVFESEYKKPTQQERTQRIIIGVLKKQLQAQYVEKLKR